MCTVLVLHRAHPAAPLVVAANRDERYDRPTTGPEVLGRAFPRIAGGRDLRHGGTWLGVNETGMLAVLTNMRSEAEDRRSRGEVVMEALGRRDLDDIDEFLLTHARGAVFRPFNLLYGSPEGLRVAHVRDDAVDIEDVGPGLHVLPSGGRLDDPELPKVQRARQRLEQAAGAASSLDGLRDALLEALADHWQPAPEALPARLRESDLGADLEARVQALCVHTPAYGTRSTAFLAVSPAGIRYEFSAGPACQARLERFDGLLGPAA